MLDQSRSKSEEDGVYKIEVGLSFFRALQPKYIVNFVSASYFILFWGMVLAVLRFWANGDGQNPEMVTECAQAVLTREGSHSVLSLFRSS